MTDFRSSLELLVGENHRRQPEDVTRATIGLIKSMEHHASERFWFNEATFLWEMTQGIYEYGATWDPHDPNLAVPAKSPPFDILQPLSIQIQVGQNWWDPMEMRGMDFIRSSVFFEGNIGYPDTYAYFDDNFWFYSIPQADFPCRIDYVRDNVNLRYTFDGTAWLFEYKSFSDGIWRDLVNAPAFVNPWLENAEPMIRAWARWNLQNSYYKDPDAAAAAYADYQVERDNLFGQRDRRQQDDIRTIPTAI